MRLLLMLAGTALLSACGAAISDRPACRVTEFPRDLQAQAAEELVTAPALRTMMDAMAADRAFNRAVR
jgi:uncharacterized protein YbaA (DUF1428 family)